MMSGSPLLSPPETWQCTIRLSDVDRDGETYSDELELALEEPIDYRGRLYSPASPIRVTVEANFTGGRILAAISASTELSAQCDRCLANTRVAINGSLRYLFSLRDEAFDDEDGEDDGEVGAIPVDEFEGEISIAPCVWEVMLLAMPQQVLCRDDCRGLCPVCGADLNAGECGCETQVHDPRFDALKQLMEDQDRNSDN